MFKTFRPLARNRDFLIAPTGRAVSVFGDEVALVALTLRLQAAGARPYLIALLLGAGLVPFVLLAGVAGRVADSADSRHVLVAATLGQVCCCIPLIFTGNGFGPAATLVAARSSVVRWIRSMLTSYPSYCHTVRRITRPLYPASFHHP